MDNEFQWSDNLLTKLNELSARQVPIPEDYQHESYALFKSRAGFSNGLVDLPLIRIPEPTMPELVIPEPDDPTLSETTLQQELIQHSEAEAAASPIEGARLKQIEIIENFIKNEPRLAPLRAKLGDPIEQVDLSERNQKVAVGMGGLATESFAKIMLKQGKVDKAIEIYEQLSLKNPQKKAYFADKIGEIKAGQV